MSLKYQGSVKKKKKHFHQKNIEICFPSFVWEKSNRVSHLMKKIKKMETDHWCLIFHLLCHRFQARNLPACPCNFRKLTTFTKVGTKLLSNVLFELISTQHWSHEKWDTDNLSLSRSTVNTIYNYKSERIPVLLETMH